MHLNMSPNDSRCENRISGHSDGHACMHAATFRLAGVQQLACAEFDAEPGPVSDSRNADTRRSGIHAEAAQAGPIIMRKSCFQL